MLTALFSFAVWSQEACKACHGTDGNSVIQGIPSIAGQPKLFIETQLVLMREGIRPAPQMAPLVKGMPDKEIVRLAEHFSKLPAKSMAAGAANPALAKRGQELGKKLRCGVCHLSDFSGQNQVPRLAGQREEYLDAEMRAYRDNKRQGGDTIMAAALYGVSDADISLREVLLQLARVEPGQVFRDLLGDQLFNFLAELFPEHAEEFRRRDQVQAVVQVAGARLVEVLAQPLGEQLHLVLDRPDVVLAGMPARESPAGVGIDLALVQAALGIDQVLDFHEPALAVRNLQDLARLESAATIHVVVGIMARPRIAERVSARSF